MMVIVVERAPPRLRGHLRAWLSEVRAASTWATTQRGRER